MNSFTFDLELNKTFSNEVVTIGQSDHNGTSLSVTLYKDGQRFTTSGLTANFVMRLPGEQSYYRKTCSYNSGIISCTIDEEYAGAVAGKTDVAYFELRQGTNVIASTSRFLVVILPSATQGMSEGQRYDDEIAATVNQWLDDHPEATTTVEDDSLTTVKLKDQQITEPKMADSSVSTRTLVDASVTTVKLADDSVVGSKLAVNSITQAKIADNSVGTAELIDSNVTTAKIADGSVTEPKLAVNSVTTTRLADGSVTDGKLANSSVVTARIADDAVTTDKLANSSVTSAKIADGSITSSKLSSDIFTVVTDAEIAAMIG